ncbi:MAG: hypothetical protein A3J93_00090 [Candidatus Magasanikbacteria bacterium RIFOXYC2_FULL_42_28]|uniref:Bifunctional protein FolD n=1 Tax=Candidatus Magasanikbacteria bacterium RIFOXYC2_FULL_42_28 TaxID=1798704 RepID=A0A1F6NW99_9BACT|nr:MAG: hypothetical protein A3J93_00090 [Candidatus Magasanikbacteria bacterium RIFOXYC2_FULL_42_28]
MSGQLINGRAIADKILDKTAKKLATLKTNGVNPELAVILVGNDKSSVNYVERKGVAAKKIGLKFTLYKFDENITTEYLITEIEKIQNDKNLAGLIAQLPLPKQIDTAKILNTIKPEIDVDCLSDKNFNKLVVGTNFITPPTPGAIMAILEDLNISVSGKLVTIVGAGALVGKPLALIMNRAGANVSLCDSSTIDTATKCREAGILITGVGKKDLIRGDMIKPGAVIIDAGIDFENNRMYGDVNIAEALAVAALVTPTPGGVGPITVAQLLWNTIVCAENKK